MRDVLLEQGMPHDADAERMILGCVILENETIYQAVEKLIPADFFLPSNRRIFEVALRLEGKGKGIDPLTIQRELEADGDLDKAGGPAYIASLFDGCPRFSDIRSYVDLVADCAIRRRQIVVGHQAMAMALDRSEPAQAHLNRAQKLICEIESRDGRAQWFDAGAVGWEVLGKIEEHAASGRYLTGIGTGFYDFDAMTGGLQKSDLIIIGGRPAMGKTAFVGGLVVGAAEMSANRELLGSAPVIGLFTLEMSKEQIVQRTLCSLAGVDAMRVRNGLLGKDDWRKLHEANGRLAALGIEIDDRAGITPMMIRSRLRQLQQRRGRVDLVVVDYLQMMTPDSRHESTEREVKENARALKAIAKDFNVPVVALASLSRKPEERSDKRPVPSDLRDSGNIESDADIVAFIYRDIVYNPHAEPLAAELIVRKQRNGPIGTCELIFRPNIARFENLARVQEVAVNEQ